MTRRYSSTSTETTLAAELSAIATTMTVAAGTASALLNGVSLTAGNVDQFTIAIDPDTASEEIVFVTNVSSNVLTIVRARAGTSGIIHLTGAKVRHVLTSDDLNYYTSGVDSAVTLTGTQTLTNKTLTAPVISTISNTGTVTLPTSTDTLVGRATTDTLTNKTLSSATLTGTVTAGGAAGTSGQFLSSTGTGVQWAAAGLVLNPMASGVYCGSNNFTGGILGTTFSANTSSFIPFLVSEDTTFDRIAIATISNFSGTGTVRLAIYNNGTNMLPNSLVLDAGTVTCTAGGTIYSITINQTLTRGWYWLAANTTSAATTHTFQYVANANFSYNYIFNKDFFASTSLSMASQSHNVTSGYPASASSSSSNSSMCIALRKA